MVDPNRIPQAVRSLYPFDSHFLDVDGGRMHYIDEGPRDGEVIVAVHGNPTWSFYWRRLVSAFKDTHRIVAMDHIGCGLSDKPQEWSYHLKDHQENLARIIEALDLQHATLVCHDWGGPTGYGAVLLAGADRFERFVVFNTLSRFGEFPLSIKSLRWPVYGSLAVRGFNAFLLFALKRGTSKPGQYKGPIGEGYLAPYRNWHDRIAIHRFIADIPVEANHPTAWAKEQLAEGIRTQADKPHLIIWGMQDFVFHQFFLRGWKEDVPGAEVIEVDDANHFVVEDAKDRVLPWVSDWLQRT